MTSSFPNGASARGGRIMAFERLSGLPPFHPAAVELVSISTESDAATDDFERVFKSDPALTADLLLMANSAAFGMRTRVGTIRHALALLGLERVRGLAANIMLAGYLRRRPLEHVQGIWLHSVATAVIAGALGEICGMPGMYTVGLMHDLGRLALLSSQGARYAEVLRVEVTDIEEVIGLEAIVCGMDHCDAGALLAGTWGFSEVFQACMAGHHDSPRRELSHPIELIRTACALADGLGYPEVRWKDVRIPPVLPHGLAEAAQLEPARLLRQIQQQSAMLVS